MEVGSWRNAKPVERSLPLLLCIFKRLQRGIDLPCTSLGTPRKLDVASHPAMLPGSESTVAGASCSSGVEIDQTEALLQHLAMKGSICFHHIAVWHQASWMGVVDHHTLVYEYFSERRLRSLKIDWGKDGFFFADGSEDPCPAGDVLSRKMCRVTGMEVCQQLERVTWIKYDLMKWNCQQFCRHMFEQVPEVYTGSGIFSRYFQDEGDRTSPPAPIFVDPDHVVSGYCRQVWALFGYDNPKHGSIKPRLANSSAMARSTSSMVLGAAATAWFTGLAFTAPGQVRTAPTQARPGNVRGARAQSGSSSFSGATALGGACVTMALVRGGKSVRKALSQDELKKMVGYKAVDDYVQSGTVIGLGTGSTAAFAVERVGEKLKSGELKDIIAIPTSIRTQEQAESLGIPLATLDTHSDLDVAIDGADEVDPALNLVKGGGGALFREKIVEMCAKKFIVIVDESKLCDGLGPGFPVPVEIVPFCHEHTMRKIASLPALKGCEPVLRLGNVANNQPDGDEPAVTDNGNYIVDLKFTSPISDPVAAGEQLKATVGVVDHGLFTGMTTACIIAGKEGIIVKD
eukprot:s14_g6.t1